MGDAELFNQFAAMQVTAQALAGRAFGAFYDRLHAARDAPDRPASSLLEAGNRWNSMSWHVPTAKGTRSLSWK